MTLETKLKITSNYVATAEQFESPNGKQSLTLSDSSDEDGNEKGQGSPRKRRILNKIEKWISHRHFATVAQSKLVKRYVGDLTNMPLTLTVEVSSLNGILIVNLPPEPSDRIWYGFQKDPDLSLNVFPKVGKLEINLSAVVLTIQKKLIQEFKMY
ncbi:testis-expressed protein 2-like [Uloborus diversus]|uniref:testis-expressed protein 2-like n=1 Tax=Uloborus diversus TaxID=327109 RepID=UPI002409CA4D|nr:testis-expressed protein 2-like [Uloborus diversus]